MIKNLCYIDTTVLLENTPLVKFSHTNSDPGRVCVKCRWKMAIDRYDTRQMWKLRFHNTSNVFFPQYAATIFNSLCKTRLQGIVIDVIKQTFSLLWTFLLELRDYVHEQSWFTNTCLWRLHDYRNIRDYFSMLLCGFILNNLVIAVSFIWKLMNSSFYSLRIQPPFIRLRYYVRNAGGEWKAAAVFVGYSF